MTGFKSFAEPEHISIDDGMTGIVGPNGCGKSNIVEALRWLMGESSAKSMRGGELEDIIFAGSASRPSRNFAEVTLTLDNTEKKAARLNLLMMTLKSPAGSNVAKAQVLKSMAKLCAPETCNCCLLIWRLDHAQAGLLAKVKSGR